MKSPWASFAVVDGSTFPQDVYAIFAAGRQNDVPTIAGSNSDEATSLSPWPSSAKAAAFVAQARRTFGDSADEFLKIYPAATDQQAEASHYASFRDQNFTWQMRTWVRMQTRTGKSKAYLYQFTRIPPGPASDRLRAFHASEIRYVFGNNLDPPRPWEAADRELSAQMLQYWVNFATHGDPNGKGLPAWPAYDAQTDRNIVFGDKISTATALNREALDFYDRYYDKQHAAR